MVALAARSSGRSTEISSQTKITTVMLTNLIILGQTNIVIASAAKQSSRLHRPWIASSLRSSQ
jgi:hypothetical protein